MFVVTYLVCVTSLLFWSMFVVASFLGATFFLSPYFFFFSHALCVFRKALFVFPDNYLPLSFFN